MARPGKQRRRRPSVDMIRSSGGDSSNGSKIMLSPCVRTTSAAFWALIYMGRITPAANVLDEKRSVCGNEAYRTRRRPGSFQEATLQ